MFRIAKSVVVVGLCVVVTMIALPQTAYSQYMGKGAGIGALLGLALSDGWDPVGDAAAGAALGAAGGGIANMATGGKKKKRENERARAEADYQRRRAEQDRYEAERARQQAEQDRRWNEMQVSQRERELLARERQLAESERMLTRARDQVSETIQAREQTEMVIVQAIGADNWEGYKALRGCQHERAFALAQVAATSKNMNHRLGSLWLEAMTAVDQRNTSKAQSSFQTLAKWDPDIDTVQQASLAADQAVLDMRSERADIGIAPCR